MEHGVVGASLVPHPPIMIPQVGGQEAQKVKKTRQAMIDLCCWVGTLRADLLLLISPHGPAERRRIPLVQAERAEGDLSDFGVAQVSVSFRMDKEFTQKLHESAHDANLPVSLRKTPTSWPLDHGAVVPMYQMQQQGIDLPMVYVGLPLVSRESLLEFGQIVDEVARKEQQRLLVVASGDLSHRLSHSAPSGYHPSGAKFDEALVEALRTGRLDDLKEMPEELVQQAGQCGYNPMLVAAGAVQRYSVDTRVYSYEGPFGVGYAVAHLQVNDGNSPPSQSSGSGAESTWNPVKLARASLRYYLNHRQIMAVPGEVCGRLQQEAGAFVTLKRDGNLRGCIGTIEPTRSTLAEEIIRNAVSAGVRDPRFSPVTPDELPQLSFSVDVLSQPEEIDSSDELDPHKYGVVVQKGDSKGLLLPDLQGIDTASEQIRVACRKAGLSADDPGLNLLRFEVQRHQE